MSDRPEPELAGVAEPDGSLDIPGTAAAQIRELATNNRLLAEGGGDPDCARVAKLLDRVADRIEGLFDLGDDADPLPPSNIVMFNRRRPPAPGGGAV